MVIDLFKKYKAVSQWVRRSPNPINMKMKDCFGRALKIQANELEMFSTVKELHELENQLRPRIRQFPSRVVEAVEEGSFIVDVPYMVAARWRDGDHQVGRIYIATSPCRKDEVKLGATTTSLSKREGSYRHKYGYPIEIVWSRSLQSPFIKEKLVQDEIGDSRVSGLTFGDSNEWYDLGVEELKSIVLLTLELPKAA